MSSLNDSCICRTLKIKNYVNMIFLVGFKINIICSCNNVYFDAVNRIFNFMLRKKAALIILKIISEKKKIQIYVLQGNEGVEGNLIDLSVYKCCLLPEIFCLELIFSVKILLLIKMIIIITINKIKNVVGKF